MVDSYENIVYYRSFDQVSFRNTIDYKKNQK